MGGNAHIPRARFLHFHSATLSHFHSVAFAFPFRSVAEESAVAVAFAVALCLSFPKGIRVSFLHCQAPIPQNPPGAPSFAASSRRVGTILPTASFSSPASNPHQAPKARPIPAIRPPKTQRAEAGCGKMHALRFSVGAQGFSPAKIPANSRGFSPGPFLHLPPNALFHQPLKARHISHPNRCQAPKPSTLNPKTRQPKPTKPLRTQKYPHPTWRPSFLPSVKIKVAPSTGPAKKPGLPL